MLDGPPDTAQEPPSSATRAGAGARPVRDIRITIYSITAAVCLTQMAMNFWLPLLPLYMQELGASGKSGALFWTALVNIVLGICRIVSGPVWGVISDRFGRKPMFIRTLLFAAGTIAIAAAARTPWHVAVAFACQGLFSGFNPAAIALMSVSVPESRLGSSLGLVTGGQYLGNTLGPALGAGLVVLLGFRGAMLAGALLPVAAALLVLLLVPRDEVQVRPAPAVTASRSSERASAALPRQFYLAVFVLFLIFAMTQVIRVLAPVVLQAIEGRDDVAGTVGLAFSLGGLAAVLGIVSLGQRFVQPGRLRGMLIAAMAVTAAVHYLLAFARQSASFVALFVLLSLVQATMIPATNTLIAANLSRARRGTGFGIASSAQALGFMVGPLTAAALAFGPTELAFAAMGTLFLALAALVLVAIREPAGLEAGGETRAGAFPPL